MNKTFEQKKKKTIPKSKIDFFYFDVDSMIESL